MPALAGRASSGHGIHKLRALVVYDTSYGNTTRIAEAIRAGLGGDAIAREVETLDIGSHARFDLYVVGSPTQGGRATPPIRAWLEGIPADVTRGARFAAFDTRLPARGLLGIAMQVIGHAAPRISRALRARGAIEVAPSEGFVVLGTAGPLAKQEEERALAWGRSLARSLD